MSIKSHLIIVFLLGYLLTLIGCKNSGPEKPLLPKDLQGEWYKRYSGIVDGNKVVVNLHHYDGKTFGFCYYPDADAFTDLIETDGSNDSFNLYMGEWERAYHTDRLDDSWALTLRGNTAIGKLFAGKDKWDYNGERKPATITLTEDYPMGAYPLEIIIHTDSVEEKMGKDFAAIYTYYQLLLPSAKMNKDESDFFNQSQLHLIGADTLGTTDVRDYFRKKNRKIFMDFRRTKPDTSSAKNSDPDGYRESQISQNLFVLYNENGLISLELHDYSDISEKSTTNKETSHYVCLDMAQKKVLALNDLIKPDTLILNQLLEAKLQTELGRYVKDSLKDTSSLKPFNSNFYLTGSGLWFCYNPYTLRKSIGEEIIVHLKWSELYGLLKEDFRKRLGI